MFFKKYFLHLSGNPKKRSFYRIGLVFKKSCGNFLRRKRAGKKQVLFNRSILNGNLGRRTLCHWNGKDKRFIFAGRWIELILIPCASVFALWIIRPVLRFLLLKK